VKQNSLEFNWQEHNAQIKKNKGFDLILGNPPYVYLRNILAFIKKPPQPQAISTTFISCIFLLPSVKKDCSVMFNKYQLHIIISFSYLKHNLHCN
jgi:hypothetical protein